MTKTARRLARGIPGVVVLVSLSSLSGCGAPPAKSGTESTGGVLSVDGKVAPDFVLKDVHGNEFRLSDTAGQVRLLDFWATWCPPCREEIPMLERLQEAYGNEGFAVIGITDEAVDVVSEYLEKHGVGYTNLIDPGDVAESYLVLGLPTGYLLDREGRIVEFYTGPKPPKALEARIRELLALPPKA